MFLLIKIYTFLGNHNCKYVCRRCLNSYASQKVLFKHKEKSGEDDLCAIRTSSESHNFWKKHFHKKPLYFRIFADFEIDIEIDISSIGNKTTNICKQNPVLNGYHLLSELDDVLKGRYLICPLGYENVVWFVDEIIKMESKIAFYFKNNIKDIILTEENEKDFENNDVCRFCKKLYF